MGFFQAVTRFGRRFSGRPAADCPLADERASHKPTIELLETRQLLAGDLLFGSVYFEEATGDDSEGDAIVVTFLGGAEGTQLNRLIIDGDKKGDGPTEGDVFFDTESGSPGAFQHVGLSIESQDGFEVTGVSVVDGGNQIVLDFSGFDPGERLVFTVDADEISFIDSDNGIFESTSVVEGGEFQRSRLVGEFSAPHYADFELSTVYWDTFEDNFREAIEATGRTVRLPSDSYSPDDDLRDRTAGAIAYARQTPLPITISGTVFADENLDNRQDTDESGIANVAIELWSFDPEQQQYVSTGKSTTTDVNGDYRFNDSEGIVILPGRYEIRETQPTPYYSVNARAGSVDGEPAGVVLDVNTISAIELVGGQESVDNDFSEARPVALSGFVYHDRDNNGRRGSGEEGIGQVPIQLIPVALINGSTTVVDAVTDSNGFWQATGLAPGEYRVVEASQPLGYLDGLDTPGTVNGRTVGTAQNPGDVITGVLLAGGETGIEYNFGELLASSISGRVHANTDGDCDLGPDDILLEGVEIDLLDANGRFLQSTTTDREGRYRFDGLEPGTYQIFERQPEGYFDGDEHPGTAGGVADGVDTIRQITLGSGTVAVDYNFCEYVGVDLSGFVYHDEDNDGNFDNEEAGIGAVTLMLLDAQGNDTGRRAVTSSDPATLGYYEFTNLDQGTYGVAERQPVGYLDGIDTPGSRGGLADNPGDRITGAVLPFGQNGENYNFGELLASSISGRVHANTDGD
ncbi:MAG: collagen binding domain-containing protein, partial [Pirellulales bacterium]